MDDGYQQVENAVLYWHKTTGYYYDPVGCECVCMYVYNYC